MFKEFALETLFDISTTKGIDKGKLTFCENGEYDFVGRQVDNYGIQGTLNALIFPANPKNTFSLVQVGNSLARFRERAWYASQNIFILKPTDNRIIDNHLYFEAILNKMMSKYGDGYSNYPTLKSLELELIKLPVIESPNPSHTYTVEDIDWQYMRDYITELERDYITELDAYLKATGLDDYELTDEDKKVLSLYKEGSASDKDSTTHFKEYKVSDVFGEALLGKYHSPESLIPDDNGYLYICASNANNGINKDMPRVNGNNLSLTPSKIIAWGKQCPMFCYHDEPCVTSQGMYFLDMQNYDEKICLYVCSALARACSDKYNYSNCLIGKAMDEETIALPVIRSSDPSHVYTVDDIDWGFMKRYIRAIEKQTIADVVRFRDRELAVTRQVVGVA